MTSVFGVLSSVKGLMHSKPPLNTHADHPLGQPVPPPLRANPIPKVQPVVLPKENSHAGGFDPRIAHVRARRASETGPAGNPAKYSSQGQGGRWDDRAEVRPLGQERTQPEERSVETRRKIEKLRREVRVLNEEKEGLKQQLLAAQAQALEAHTKYSHSLEKAKTLQNDNERLLSHIKDIKSHAATKEQVAVRRIGEVESRNQQQEVEIRTLRQQILQSNAKQANTDQLLQARTADLKGVETFLTTADEYSGAEIMTMVESLNGEIFQVSAFMAETLESGSLVATPEEQAKNMANHRETLEFARKHIGDLLFAHLRDKSLEVRTEALPLQLGLQALLTTWCICMVRSFTYARFDNDLQKLYQQIRKSEAQSIAGRWRAITSTQMRFLASEPQKTFMIDMLLSLMCLCGWSISNQQSPKVVSSLQQMVERIEKMWSQLKKATKEGITNTDMEVFNIEPGSTFGENMEDVYDEALGKTKNGEPERRRRGKTLCTVGIGLRKSLVKHGESGEPLVQRDVLIKPKVALASVLLEAGMMGESRPRSQYFGK